MPIPPSPKWKRLLLGLVLGLIPCGAASGQESQGRCLPRETGERLTALVESGALRAGLPPGWIELDQKIDPTAISLTFLAPGGQTVGMVLTPDPVEKGPLRWFSARPPSDTSPEVLTVLEKVAAEVDSAFSSAPWVACVQGHAVLLPEGSVRPGPDVLTVYPRWLALLLGTLQALLIAAGVALVLKAWWPPKRLE
jgi:hypothetical protein